MLLETKSILYIYFLPSFVSPNEEGVLGEGEKDAYISPPWETYIEAGGSQTVLYPSVHVYKVRLIRKFCNVFLNVHVVLVDKGKAFSPFKFNGLGKGMKFYPFGNLIQGLCISSVIYILFAPLIGA